MSDEILGHFDRKNAHNMTVNIQIDIEATTCPVEVFSDHDDVIKWKQFPRYWPFVRGIQRSPVTGEFPSQKPVTRSLDVFFGLCLNKRLGKQSWGWWFETPSRWSWRHYNDTVESHWENNWRADTVIQIHLSSYRTHILTFTNVLSAQLWVVLKC